MADASVDIFSDTNHYIRFITPKQADPTYSLLKAHLMFEEMLNEYIKRVVRYPDALAGARLTFAQRLAVARACSKHLPPDDWRWKAIGELNRLRNMLAHNLEAENFKKKEQRYVDLIVSHTSPLPTPAMTIAGDARPITSQPMFLTVDLVTAVLFGSTAVRLGLDSEGLVQNVETQEQELKEATSGSQSENSL